MPEEQLYQWKQELEEGRKQHQRELEEGRKQHERVLEEGRKQHERVLEEHRKQMIKDRMEFEARLQEHDLVMEKLIPKYQLEHCRLMMMVPCNVLTVFLERHTNILELTGKPPQEGMMHDMEKRL